MKLWYVTNVNLMAQDAQSVQIRAMSRSFQSHPGLEFRLISPVPMGSEWTSGAEWDPVPTFFRKRMLRYLEFSLRIAPSMMRNRPEIFSRDIGICLLAWVLGLRAVYEIHKEPRFWAGRALKLLAGRRRFRCVSISEALRNWCCEMGFSHPGKVLAVHDGVFVDEYDRIRHIDRAELRGSLGLDIERFVLMHSGSLYPGRGEELFGPVLEAFPGIVLVQVGGREADVRRVRARFQGFENLVFVPRQGGADLVRWQMAADALLYINTRGNPLWWCSSPLKVFEYLATGRPLVATNIGSTAEVLDDGVAYLYDPEDPSTLVRAVGEMLDSGTRSDKGAKGLDRVRSNYTWQKRADHIVDFLKAEEE